MNDLLSAIFAGDPAGALMAALLGANLVAGVTVAAVALARLPARRRFGPASTYHLWVFPPLAFAASFLALLVPWGGGDISRSTAAGLAAQAPQLGSLGPGWALGVAGLAALFVLAHLRFLSEVRAGRGGPAVVGFISPRIVLPANDGYSAAERELVRLHERAHVARKDPRAAGLAAGFQCLCWFNPMAHLASYLLRLDQELACDAAVVLGRPEARGLYARTLLKTQLASQPLPFGCYWPARGQHPLEVRIGLLKRAEGVGGKGAAVVRASVDAIRP